MTHILMVCKANVCRSPMAQIVATYLAGRNGLLNRVHVDSAGTHADKIRSRIDTRAAAALKRRGYVVGKTRSRRIEDKDFQHFDLILAMDHANFSELQRLCPPESVHKLHMFLAASQTTNTDEVPDPFYGNTEGFERVLDLCEAGVQWWLNSTFS